MVELPELKAELNRLAKISINLKEKLDNAKTNTKREYVRAKLLKNNTNISELLQLIERKTSDE